MINFAEIPASPKSLGQRKKVCGVGINDAPYITNTIIDGIRVKCPYYSTWCSMLVRCYSENSIIIQPTYIHCIVCDEWLTFSNFKKWMKQQEWQDNELDKDLKIAGNVLYSPDTCMFVSPSINKLLNTHKNRRGRHPQGVSYHSRDHKFEAYISTQGVRKYLGRFPTCKAANTAYISAKYRELIRLSALPENTQIRQCLVDTANSINKERCYD